MAQYDVAIIGGGCVGLSVGYHLAARTDLDICIVEKEYHLAEHQSGRNSGVLHPGFNYPPDSLQAEFATRGTRRMKDYCQARDVPLEECGVLVVAQTRGERLELQRLQRQATANGVETRLLESEAAL